MFATEPTQLPPEPAGLQVAEYRTPTPIDILQTAVDRGLDADQLEKLMLMQERWEAGQAKKQFSEAMHNCQQEMPQIVKDAENSHTRSRYALLETVQKHARPVYAKHGFSLSFGEADCPTADHKRTVCDVRHSGGHCERYHIDLPIDGEGAKGGKSSMNAVQGSISTTSYGQRRLICMIFNITVADEDDDGQTLSKINEQQYATLEDWIELLKPTPWKLGPFLNWLQVKSIGELPAAKFNQAANELQAAARKHGVAK